MADASALGVTEGDTVRVHYHPPSPVISFVEGVVLWVDVTSTGGAGFLINITRDVFLGQEQPITFSFQHYVTNQQSDDFPGRVEVRSRAGCQSETQEP
jgi:hypothetical protein